MVMVLCCVANAKPINLKERYNTALMAIKKAHIDKGSIIFCDARFTYSCFFKKSSPCVCAAKNHGFSIIVYWYCSSCNFCHSNATTSWLKLC